MQEGLYITIQLMGGESCFQRCGIVIGDEFITKTVFLSDGRQAGGGVVVIQRAQSYLTAVEIILYHKFHGEPGDNMVCTHRKGQRLVIAGHSRQQVNLHFLQLIAGLPPVYTGNIGEFCAQKTGEKFHVLITVAAHVSGPVLV